MIRAAVKEIQNNPIASLGAVAGVLSFAFVLVEPGIAPANAAPSIGSVEVALAFVKLSLVTPALAFFFAFAGSLVLSSGVVRGVAVSAVLFFVSSASSAAMAGLTLSPFDRVPGNNSSVLGIELTAFAATVVAINFLVFGGVLGEASLARYRKWQLMREEDERFDDSVVPFIILPALFIVVATGAAAFAILQACLTY